MTAVTLRGFLGLSPAGKRTWFDTDEEIGDAPLFTTGVSPTGATDEPDDWPMYRKDFRRSNATSAKIVGTLEPQWSAKLGTGHLTQATTAYGRVYVGEHESHRVFCRDAVSGQNAWSFVADGRVEYPPTLYQGLCLFGTGAGSVYCLDAINGQEIWRLRAAPAQKFIADRNKFDSAWPVVGGVMIFDGVAHFGAGRSRSQSGGMWIFAVDPASGEIKWRTHGGSSGDLFVSDGKLLCHTLLPYLPKDGARPIAAAPVFMYGHIGARVEHRVLPPACWSRTSPEALNGRQSDHGKAHIRVAIVATGGTRRWFGTEGKDKTKSISSMLLVVPSGTCTM